MPTNKRYLVDEGLAQKIATLIEPSVEGLGYQLVRVMLVGPSKQTLQIMAERPDGHMNVDDCANITRIISPLLDVEDPISHAYTLEVSSPGIDRPLVRISDFTRYEGCEAKIELKTMRDGRKRYRGRLAGVDNEHIGLDMGDGHDSSDGTGLIWLDLNELKSAKLVMTDALITFTESIGLIPKTSDDDV